MSIKSFSNRLPLALFVVFAAYVLVVMFPDMLYTAQDRNEFFCTGQFFRQSLHEPFGLMAYLGGYLTQYFYHPFLGAGVLLVLWCAIYFVTLEVVRPKGGDNTVLQRWLAVLPVGCLLGSITQVGYWIYILTMPGYWFSQTLAYLCVLLMLWGARITPKAYRAMWYTLGSIVCFHFIGIYSYFFAICLFMMQIADKPEDRTHWWQQAGGLLAAIIYPLGFVRICLPELNFRHAILGGLPYFESNADSTLHNSYPFILMTLLTLVLLYSVRWVETAKPKKLTSWLTAALTAVVLVGGVLMVSFRDYNYQAEMRMTQAALDDDWQTIMQEQQKAKQPSRTMVVLNNIALFNVGELGNRAFQQGCSGLNIYNPDSLNVNLMHIASPLGYYNHGKVQYAIRWCMENTGAYGMSPFFLKMNMRCALATGEKRLYDRYQKLLKHTSFHGDWRPVPTTPIVLELQRSFTDVIDSDNDDCERYLIENFSLAKGSSSKFVQELNLFYCMLYRNPMMFWDAFYAYARHTNGANLPLHYQEAYVIMMQNYKVKLPFDVQITPSVQQNYQAYGQAVGRLQQQGLTEEQVGEALRNDWHHTYWWYLMYGRKTY